MAPQFSCSSGSEPTRFSRERPKQLDDSEAAAVELAASQPTRTGEALDDAEGASAELADPERAVDPLGARQAAGDGCFGSTDHRPLAKEYSISPRPGHPASAVARWLRSSGFEAKRDDGQAVDALIVPVAGGEGEEAAAAHDVYAGRFPTSHFPGGEDHAHIYAAPIGILNEARTKGGLMYYRPAETDGDEA